MKLIQSLKRSARVRVAFFLILAFATAAPALAQDPISRTTQQTPQARTLGDSKVALQNGAMTSEVAIALPAYHGLTPRLSLNYSSSSGTGFVGVGWSLQGFSAIERISPNRGSPRFLQAAGNDSYLLDGEELVPSTALGGNYSTRRESFLRISGSGSSATWTVTQRDGTVMTYSRVFTEGSATTRWGLTKVQDVHGNVVNYAWACENGASTLDCYPASISYANTVVTIFKETRTDPETFATGYKLGRTNYRLRSVSVTVGGSLLRAYKLTYAASARSARSLLKTVQQFGRDASVDAAGNVSGGTSLPPLTITWADTASGLEPAVAMNDKYGLSLAVWQHSEIYTDDFDGDGRTDFLIIYLNGTTPKTYLLRANATGSFNNAVDITNQSGMSTALWQYSHVEATGDFNGDGVADLLLRYSQINVATRIYQLLGSGTGTFGTARNIANSFGMNDTAWTYSGTTLADFNGDGKADLLLRGLNGTYFAYMLTASANGDFSTRVDVANLYGMTGDKWNSYPTLGDFNGDGKTDLILRHLSTLEAYLLLASPTGGFNTMVNVTAKYGLTGNRWFYGNLVPGDFNGDGRTDIFFARDYLTNTYPFEILYAQGSDGYTGAGPIAFENSIDLTNASGMNDQKWRNATIVSGDFNGDGRSDLLVSSAISSTQDASYLLFSNGPGFQAARDVTSLYGMSTQGWAYADFRIGDFDSDGDDDLFEFGQVTTPQLLMPFGLLKGNGSLGNLITQIANGYGGTTSVTYVPSANWVNSNNPPRSQTVSSLTTADGRGWSSTTNYSYSGGAWDPIERRHLGFRFVKSTDPTGAYEETYFYIGAMFSPGEIEDSYVKNSLGGVMTRTYRTLTGSTGAPWVRNLTRLDEYECNGDASCKQRQKDLAYDAYGNVTSAIEHGEVDTSVTGDERTTTYSYYPNSSSYIVSSPAIVSTYKGTSAAGALLRQTRTYYDNGLLGAAPGKGDPTRTESWLNSTNGYVGTTAAFDAFGNKTSETDALGHSTVIGWDASGMFPVSTTNALGQIESSTWDTVCGQPLSSTDSNNQTSTWEYDALCRKKKAIRPDTGWTDFGYIQYGVAPSLQYDIQTIHDGAASAQWRASYFDGLGREWQSFNNAVVAEVVETTYDSRGLVSTVSAPYSTDAKKLTTYSYDALKRLVNTTYPDASTRQTLYGDWFATTCDELGMPRTRYRDAYDQVRQVREYLATACATLPACTAGSSCFDTRIDYDLLGQRIAVTDAVGAISVYGYDSLGRRTSVNDPDMGAWSYVFDDANRLVSQTDAKANTIQLEYDALNRVTRRKTSAGLTLASYFYDEAGHGYSTGRRTRMVDPSGSASATYDRMGQVTSEAKQIGAVTYVTGKTYDLEGRLTSITYPDGELLPYTYDQVGRLATAGSYVTGASYDARGNVTSRILGNGVSETLTYDVNRFWLTSASAKKGATLLLKVALGHNIRGEVTSRTTTPLAAKDDWTYVYDDLRHLKTATSATNAAWSQDFTFDAAGRMTSQTGLGTYAYPSTGPGPRHAPSMVGASQHTYDANGNLVSGSGNSLSYDLENHPLTANGYPLSYDGDGDRVTQGATAFISDLYEVDTSTGASTNYINFGPIQVARKRGGVISYYHGDQLGSVAAVTDSAGAVVLRKVYSPFGRVLKVTGTLVDPFGLAGQRLDPSGLYHMGAREMSPSLGIFITPDPSNAPDPELPQTFNRFSYADGAPTNLFDPTGYAAQRPWIERFKDVVAPTGQELVRRGTPGTWSTNTVGGLKDIGNKLIGFAEIAVIPPPARMLGAEFPHIHINDNELEGAAAAELGFNICTVFAGPLLKAQATAQVGYHATQAEAAESILANGFRAGTKPGRLGSGGVYVNNTVEGAIAEFEEHYPGQTPTILKVRYQPGVNARASVAPRNYVENLPLKVDSISAPSVRAAGTLNTHVLNGSARATEIVQ